MEAPPKKKRKPVVVEPEPEEEQQEEVIQEEEESGSTLVNVGDISSEIKRLLKMSSYEPHTKYWLDTGFPELNAALGSKDRGLAYGKLYELSGPEHGGKTACSTVLAGMAQQDGAAIGYIDLEDSYDPIWAKKLGLDPDNVILIAPKLLKVGGKKGTGDVRLESAEEIFSEVEAGMKLIYQRNIEKQFWLLDSIANIQTQMNLEAGTENQNMRTKVDRAQLLSNMLPRWVALASNYGAMVIMINQLRDNIGVMYGSKETTPGGRAVKFTSAIRAKIRRLKNGQLRQNGKIVGICGKIVNEKNKSGEGSNQGDSCGFRIRWDRTKAKIEFMSLKEAEALMKGEEV